MNWRWISKNAVMTFHAMQLAEHGGGTGVRDEGLLESALNRPVNLAAYGTPTVFDLAAAYAFGIAKNHPFIDGNKRTAFVAAAVFLELNGHSLNAGEADAVLAVLGLASGTMEETAFAEWLKTNSVKA